MELESLREEHVKLIQDNALLRAELTRQLNVPRYIAHAQQALANAKCSQLRAEQMCEALKRELSDALLLADRRAASAVREGGGGGEVICCGVDP
jgi:hypothetical protein|tara:strand:- start:159 stop:440 length:282 start_codon:yes stop_codon:yes gene_type:complete